MGKLEWLGYNLVTVAWWPTQSFGHNISTWQTDRHIVIATAAITQYASGDNSALEQSFIAITGRSDSNDRCTRCPCLCPTVLYAKYVRNLAQDVNKVGGRVLPVEKSGGRRPPASPPTTPLYETRIGNRDSFPIQYLPLDSRPEVVLPFLAFSATGHATIAVPYAVVEARTS